MKPGIIEHGDPRSPSAASARMILFVDQSGQLGGAELCMADIAASFLPDAQALLLADGPFAEALRLREIAVDVLPLPGALARASKQSRPKSIIIDETSGSTGVSPVSPTNSAGIAPRQTGETPVLPDGTFRRRSKQSGGTSFLLAAPATLAFLLRLQAHLRRADVLYFNTAKALLFGCVANIIARKPAIFHLHDLWTEDHFSARNIRLLVAAANCMDQVIANSRASADAFRRAGGTAPVQVIPNGFDAAPFDAVSEETIRSLRARWNPQGGPVAAVFGRLARWKGQRVLIEAAQRIPNLTVWVVGEAFFTEDDAAYAEELREAACPLGPRVQFLGFQPDVPSLMRAADLIVHTSTAAEPFGRVVVEGMLARKPVIATSAGGPGEILADGISGILVPPADVDAMADAMAKVINDPALAARLGATARERAVSDYSLERVCRETRAVVESLR